MLACPNVSLTMSFIVCEKVNKLRKGMWYEVVVSGNTARVVSPVVFTFPLVPILIWERKECQSFSSPKYK